MALQSFKELKDYIIAHLSTAFPGIIFSTNNAGGANSIYLYEKPSTQEIYGNAIIIKPNELNGGNTVRHFALELRILGVDIPTTLKIRDGLVKLLDFNSRPCDIGNYTKLTYSNESGIYFDETNDFYIDKLFFDCKLV